MIELTCHCGHIRLEVSRLPDFIHECNCTLCSKSGARWAYFHPSEVHVAGEARGYCRDDKGLDIEGVASGPDIPGVDVDVGTNKKGNLDVDVSTDGTDASNDRPGD